MGLFIMRDEQFEKYNNRVRYLTERNLKDANLHYSDRFNYNIDHIFPIRKGYELGVPEQLIASTDNLQIMHRTLNREKGSKITEVPNAILEWFVDNDIYWK